MRHSFSFDRFWFNWNFGLELMKNIRFGNAMQLLALKSALDIALNKISNIYISKGITEFRP